MKEQPWGFALGVLEIATDPDYFAAAVRLQGPRPSSALLHFPSPPEGIPALTCPLSAPVSNAAAVGGFNFRCCVMQKYSPDTLGNIHFSLLSFITIYF